MKLTFKNRIFPFFMSAAVVSLFLAVVIPGCQKGAGALARHGDFSADVAKEWWYGTFRKSAEYSGRDAASVLAPPAGTSVKKYPSWDKSLTYTIGELQVVELPLVFQTNSILLPGMQGLYNTPEGARIAHSAIHRLVILKKKDGPTEVRTVTLVPSPAYARLHNYDMSHVRLQNLPADFTGYQMISGWDDGMKNLFAISAGNHKQKIKLLTAAQRTTMQGSAASRTAEQICHYEWVPHYVWVCAVVPTGDQAADDQHCREIGSWVEQGGDWEEVCEEQPGDGEEPDPCDGMTDEECVCMMYGIGCGGGVTVGARRDVRRRTALKLSK